MKIITSVRKARETVLRRSAPETQETPAWMKDRISRAFGRAMSLQEVVDHILARVRSEGDQAVLDLEWQLNGVKPARLEVARKEITGARSRVDSGLIAALELAADRIRSFHEKCRRQSWVEFGEGGLGQWFRPIERVGLYVPGGRASYPSTLLMTAVPARVAGVEEIVVTVPCGPDGGVPVETLLAADIAGVDRVFSISGAQAIAAMAFGTKTVPRVNLICGPGNIFVQLAKKTLYGVVGIDGFYGPTETIVIADETAKPAYCAADLLAQAEHDAMASAILITTSRALAGKVSREVDRVVAQMERSALIRESLDNNGGIVVVPDLKAAMELANEYAPEHVSLMVKDPWYWAEKINNAGGIFIGEDSPEVIGDYIAGPSHVMPTGGTAHFSSPVTLDNFLKVISVVALDRKTLRKVGPAAAEISRTEKLTAHSRAVDIRLGGG